MSRRKKPNNLIRVLATGWFIMLAVILFAAGTPSERQALEVFTIYNIACVILLIWRRR